MKRPGPYHSKYVPFVHQIKAWRQEGQTWKQVVAGLDAQGCKADEGGVCRFIKRFETKPYGIGQRPEPEAGHPNPGADPEVRARKEEPEPQPVSKHTLTQAKPDKLKIQTIQPS